jgi:hypothetical protein
MVLLNSTITKPMRIYNNLSAGTDFVALSLGGKPIATKTEIP